MRTRKSLSFCLFLTVGMLTAGCQQEPGALTPVSGRVTCMGVPLQGGIIVFSPDASKGNKGPIAYSKIGPDGTFSLMTGDETGARPGWYRVTIGSAQPGQTSTPGQSVVPDAKYHNPESSKIVCQVKANEPNNYNFDLEK